MALAHDQGGAPFGKAAGFQCGQGVGHLVDQCGRESEVAAAAGRGIVAGQRDLAGQPASAFAGRDTPLGLGGPAPDRQGGGEPCLPRGGDRFEGFQVGDLGDQRRLVSLEIHHCIEHVFEYSVIPDKPEAGENR